MPGQGNDRITDNSPWQWRVRAAQSVKHSIRDPMSGRFSSNAQFTTGLTGVKGGFVTSRTAWNNTVRAVGGCKGFVLGTCLF